VLEKAVDFSNLDTDILIEAIEATYKMFPAPPKEAEPPRFSPRSKPSFNQGNQAGSPMASSSG
jgi:hypothetical protein